MLSKSLKDPEALQIAFAKASEQAIIARATQQLNLQNRMRLLDRDVSRALRLGKARIDNLDDLEKRVQKMRQQLREPSQTSAAEEVNMDLRRNNKVQIDAHFTVCARCQRRIRTNCFNAHDYACAQRQGKAEERPPIYDVKQDIKTEITTFIPQPPRNIKMKAKGSTFISWEWEPSVFDGGLPVTDYEISYSLKSSELDRLTGKYVFRSDSIPSLRTSTWCRESPICHRGFKIVNLRAATEYGDFQIRCCNLR
jgi:type II secretory pathway component PulJ